MLMMASLLSCSDDEGKIIPAHTEEEKQWILDNQN